MPWTSGPAQLAPPEPTIIRPFPEVGEEVGLDMGVDRCLDMLAEEDTHKAGDTDMVFITENKQLEPMAWSWRTYWLTT